MDRGIVIGLTSFVVTATILAIPSVANSHGRDGGALRGEPVTRVALQGRIAEHFAEADANGDGAITHEEAQAHHAARRAERRDRHFSSLDADGSGEISVAERDAARARRHARRDAMMAEDHDMRGRLTEEEMAPLREAAPEGALATPAERHARWMEHRNQAWSAADADGNGSLNRAEFDAMNAARRERMREHMAGAEGEGRRHRRNMHHGDRFERMDANSDGRVTLAELSERALARFDRADADGDGTVTVEERRAAHRAMRDGHREQREDDN